MDDLPELPFEKVLSYLSLEDRLKARAVSRRWYYKINCFRVKSLCYSDCKRDFIYGKRRWVSGVFAQNFISSTRFTTFFDIFGQTILFSLKHLRLCHLDLKKRDPTAFARTLNSFGQLEQLDIIEVEFDQQDVFNLNLPMLTRLQFEELHGIEKLTLESPRLQEVKIRQHYGPKLRVEIVYDESVERLLLDRWEYTEVKKLKNLQYLYVCRFQDIDSTLLSSLQKLKEIHIQTNWVVSKLFEQKQRSGRADLKIYFCGLLQNGPDDPTINALTGKFLNNLSGRSFVCLAENRSRLADEIPFFSSLHYSKIEELVAPDLEVDFLKRFTDLNEIVVLNPVQDIQRFLDLLKNCQSIFKLVFFSDQPQDLFNRLSEHCAVQYLHINLRPSDLDFLFRLKHLIHLHVHDPIGSETVRRALEELPALSSFHFRNFEMISIKIGQSRQFEVKVGDKKKTVSDLNAVIEFIFGKEKPSRPEKRKADDLK